MATRSVGSIQTKVYQVVFGLLFVVLGIYCVQAISSGSTGLFRMVAAIIVLAGIVLALDRRYWILFVILSTVGWSIPNLPFSGMELSWLVVVAIHWMRIAFHRDASAKLDRGILAAMPFILWVLLIFCLNPVGLARYGADTMGGRFYFQIFLSFFAFMAVSSLVFDEKDAKFVFWTLFICCAVSGIRSIIRHEIKNLNEDIAMGGSSYYLIPMTHVYILCCSRWSLSSIIKRPHRLFLFTISAILSLVSGKRQMFGRVVLCPLFRVFVTKRDFMLTAFLGLLGLLCVFVAVAGDGTFYTLSPGVRRSLAIVVPSYKTRSDDGGMDDLFRREVRKEAYALIRDKPLLGRKGFAMDFEQTVWQNTSGKNARNLYAGHAEAGNWHNLYLAYACDFGIPGFVLAMILLLYSLNYAYQACRIINTSGYYQACCLFFAFKIFDLAIFGWVSGGSAISTYLLFNHLGLLIATVNGFKSSLVRQAENPSLPSPTQILLSNH